MNDESLKTLRRVALQGVAAAADDGNDDAKAAVAKYNGPPL